MIEDAYQLGYEKNCPYYDNGFEEFFYVTTGQTIAIIAGTTLLTTAFLLGVCYMSISDIYIGPNGSEIGGPEA